MVSIGDILRDRSSAGRPPVNRAAELLAAWTRHDRGRYRLQIYISPQDGWMTMNMYTAHSSEALALYIKICDKGVNPLGDKGPFRIWDNLEQQVAYEGK